MSFLTLLTIAWIALALLMLGLYLVQRHTGDAGLVDAGWAGGIGLLAIFFAFAGQGLAGRRLLIAAMVVLWSARLTAYLLRDRVLGGAEDGRYQALREQWGAGFQARIFWFFQAQGLLSVLFAVPALVAMASTRAQLGLLDGLALLIWLVAITGETVADRQLAAFRADPANRGQTCRRGLWRYSRHPNYFFEWLHWWSYAVVAVGAPLWWLAWAAPMVMLVFILFITGIPPTEARAARSRSDYEQYRQTTSAFVPWFPRSAASS